MLVRSPGVAGDDVAGFEGPGDLVLRAAAPGLAGWTMRLPANAIDATPSTNPPDPPFGAD